MSLATAIAGTSVSIKDGSLQIEDTADFRSIATFAVEDPSGNNHFQSKAPVSITDSVNGLLFAGFLDQGDENKLVPNPDIITATTFMDNHYLPDKRRCTVDYQNMAAGDIATDMLSRYLAGEGITAGYAYRRESTQSDFSAGTLTGVSSALNVGDGDLELSSAGSAVSILENTTSVFSSGSLSNVTAANNTLMPTATPAIKLVATCSQPGSNTAYTYVKIWSGSHAVPASEYCSYDIFIMPTSPNGQCSVDMIFTDGTSWRDTFVYRDVQYTSPHPNADVGPMGVGQWYHRLFFMGNYSGKTVQSVMVACEGDSVGVYTAYFKNIRFDNSAFYFFQTALQTTPQQMQNNGYSSAIISVVNTYNLSGCYRVSPSYSINAVSILKTSFITWTAIEPAGTKLQMKYSIDGGLFYFVCTKGQPLPQLLPGSSVAGKSLIFAALYIPDPAVTGTSIASPEVAPSLSSMQVTLQPSYAATKADVVYEIAQNADWAAGTFTNTTNNSGRDLSLIGAIRNWDNGDFSNQTLWTTSGFQSPNRQAFMINAGNLAAGKSQMNFAGQMADGIIEMDILLDNANAYLGCVYRTTFWSNTDNTYAYVVQVTTNTIILGRGSNSSVASYTQIASATLNVSSGNWHRLKVVFVGSNHKLYLDDVLYINATDATYLAAGYVGLRVYNNTGATYNGMFDNFGVLGSGASLTGTWVSANQLLTSAGTYGGSIVTWNDVSSDIGNTDTILVETQVDGSTWQTATNGAPIPNLTIGQSLSGINLKVRITLTTTTASTMPGVDHVVFWVLGAFNSSGNRIAPVLSLTPVGRAGSTMINWTAQNALTTKNSDTFAGRTTTPGQTNAAFGTASDGSRWLFEPANVTNHLNASVANGEGNVYYDNAGSGTGTFIGSFENKILDVDVKVRFAFLSNVGTPGSPLVFLYGRYQDSGNYYKLECYQGGGYAHFTKVVASVATGFGPVPNFTFTVGTYYWARMQIEGSSLRFKLWQDGTTEPTIWLADTTDTAFASAGYAAIGAQVAGLTSGAGINFDNLTVSAVNIGVDVSPDGTTWTDVTAYQGQALPSSYIYTQPAPWLDFFSADSHTSYTQDNFIGGGPATWTWDTANRRLVATQTTGVNGVLQYSGFSRLDMYAETDFNYSDSGGLVVRQMNSGYAYYISIADASASSNPNTVQLKKIVAGVISNIGSAASISFVRGDYHHFKLDIQGTVLKVSMDGMQILSATDSGVSSAGVGGLFCGLANNHKIQVYGLRVQPYGDNLSGTLTTTYVPRVFGGTLILSSSTGGKIIYWRLRLSTTDPQNTPQVLDFTLSVHDPNIQNGAIIPSTNYAGIGTVLPVSDALNDLASQSNFLQYIGNKGSENKKLFFHSRTARPAPYYVYSGGSGAVNGTGGNILLAGPPTVSRPDMLYRNRQTVDGGIDTASTLPPYTLPFDGITQSWPMAYPLNAAPTIIIDGITQSIGVSGVDSGKQFYYQVGSNIISQDPNGIPPAKTSVGTVTYVGQIPVRVTRDNVNGTGIYAGTIGQTQLAAIDLTSGVVEDYVSIPGLTKAAATAKADALLNQYGQLGIDIRFSTNVYGLQPGQVISVTLAEHQIYNQQFLITKISTTVAQTVPGANPNVIDYLLYTYKVEATQGPILGDWAILLGKALKAA